MDKSHLNQKKHMKMQIACKSLFTKGVQNVHHLHGHLPGDTSFTGGLQCQLEMWANAQRDGRPAEYRWRPLFNAAVWLTPTTRVLCSNAAKKRNPLKLPGVPQTNETISAASGP